ncbi:MAG TPA: hypothetical protein DCY13_13440 [Verrucomicrobiales bacterium]|nr:hypothetical protein [Verrucomicrobiales bacterium]
MIFRIAAILSLLCLAPAARAQTTTFNYQGRLVENGAPFTGNAEFQFTLWDGPADGTQIAAHAEPTVALGVTNGLFMAELNFGPDAFPGGARWLQIAARTSLGAFVTLTPRQPVTSAPYAITAGSLSGPLAAGQISGTLSSAQLAGAYDAPVTFTNTGNVLAGNGAGLTGVNAATLGGLDGSKFWQLGGNTGTTADTHFIGTGDGQPLDFRVNNQRAIRIAPSTGVAFGNTPNLVLGSHHNVASNQFSGSVILGGGYAPLPNRVGGDYATVVGGAGNVAIATYATAMGGDTTARGFAALSTGFETEASGITSTAMGSRSVASGRSSFALGEDGTASGDYSFALGQRARALHAGAFVWADGTFANFDSTANNQFAVRAAGGIRLAGNVQIGIDHGDYRQLRVGGGNSSGYLYGSFPRFADGVHLGYNYYANAAGGDVVPISGGATSRITAGYGFVTLAVGGVGAAPTTERLVASSSGVTVYGSFNNSSDRDLKQGFKAVSPDQMLEKVARLPITEWSYRADPDTRHIGPVAQDFHELFGVGTDDRHIAPLDEGGVALAAIQGLNRKLEEKEARIRELEERLQAIETLLRK